MEGLGLRPPCRPLPEISDRVHRCGGYPYRLRIGGFTFELLEILRQYLYCSRLLLVWCRRPLWVDTYTVAPYPRIRNWPYVRPVAAVYVPVLSDLTVRDRRGVTLDELPCAYPTGPQKTARALREGGWLLPIRSRGAWGFVAWCGVPAVGGG